MSRPRIAFGAAALLLAAVLGGEALAQDLGEERVWTRLALEPAEAAPGALVTARLTVDVVEGWHIYGTAPKSRFVYATKPLLVLPEGFSTAGELSVPEPTIHRDETLGGEEVPWYTGTFAFSRSFRVARNAPPGPVEIRFDLDHMACDLGMCLDPRTVSATATLTVLDRPAVAEPGTSVEPPPPPPDEGLAGFLLTAWLGGLLSILLPCVYPLIPLTMAFFSKGGEKSRGREILRAVLFCAGILLTFTVLGLLLGRVLQELAVSVWLNVFLFLLMSVLALSLLGMFDIQLPSSWTGRLQAAGSGASAVAPVFMGVAFSFASFSCTVGVIGPILAGGAGGAVRSAAGMAAYAVGFALPFFALALFPMAMSSLPRSGGWMNTMKVMLGFFEICFAGYYLWRMDVGLGWGIGSYEIILVLWIATTFVAGLYLLGKVRLPKDDPVESVTVPRAVGAILFLAFALYLCGGFMNQVRFPGWLYGLLPPTKGEGVAPAPRPEFADAGFHPSSYNGLWWTSDLDHGLEIGRRSGKKVFLNFTGIYCTNCREVEKGHMLDPQVREALSGMVLVELWTDITTKAAEREFQDLHHTTVEQSRRYNELRQAPRPEGYGTVANPWYVILSPSGTRLRESGYPQGGVNGFRTFLEAGE